MFFDRKNPSLTKTKSSLDEISEYPLSPLEVDKYGQYLFPSTPCGVLPFVINHERKIVWGCIETNRVGIKSTHPPAGTQDIIVTNGTEHFSIEISKPLPDLNKNFLKLFTGKNVSGQTYQNIINCFIEFGYEVFLESTLATAIHETHEEHGVDLSRNGLNQDLVINMYDFEPQAIKAKRGMTTQKIYAAHLLEATNIKLNYTDKVEEKILVNRGRAFYEKGIWCTLEELKSNFQTEKSNFNLNTTEFTSEQKNLIEAEFTAWESRIELVEKVEASIVSYLKAVEINSSAKAATIQFSLLEIQMLQSKNYSQ